jgi:hypothetical protein
MSPYSMKNEAAKTAVLCLLILGAYALAAILDNVKG